MAARHAQRLMPGNDGAASALARASAAAGRLRALRNAAAGILGGIAGLAPHALHHIGLLARTALIAGAGGTACSGSSARSPPGEFQ